MFKKILNKKIVLVIICLFMFIGKGYALDVIPEGATADGIYYKCGDHPEWNGCLGNGGWIFTIVKDVNLTSTGITYTKVSDSKEVKYDPASLNVAAHYYKWDVLSNEVKTGGAVFENILQITGTDINTFIEEDYVILVEIIKVVYYDSDGIKPYIPDSTMSGTSSYIATQLLEGKPYGRESLLGITSVKKQIPCELFLRYNDDYDKYCDEDPSNYKENRYEKYLDIAKNNSRYGKGLIRAGDINVKGSITITKRNSATGKKITLASGHAKFQLYKGTNCSGTKVGALQTVTVSGTLTFSNLYPGTYSIKEESSPTGYIDDKKCVFTEIKLAPGENLGKTAADELTVKNTPGCEVRLIDAREDGIATPNELIAIFSAFPRYNSLLDFSNNGENADCSSAICVNNYSGGCLNFSSPVPFNEHDFVCYDFADQDEFGNYYAFCKTTISLSNNLVSSKFYGFAGRFLIQYIESTGQIKYYSITEVADNKIDLVERTKNASIATATLKRICYLNKDSSMDISDPETEDLKLYFGDNDNDGEADLLLHEEPVVLQDNEEDNSLTYFDKYTYELAYNYKFSNVYLQKISGRPIVTNIGDGAVISPFGILSSFIPTNDDINEYSSIDQLTYQTIPFKFENGEDVYVDENNNYCLYSTFPKIIKYDKPQLEFRIINTNNPFSGKNADCRDTNTNWCDGDDCSCDNDVVENIILKGVNSHGMKEGSAQDYIYKITLTPSDIKLIREYNEENEYDNYEMYCDGEDDCINAFIYSLMNETLEEYDTNNYVSVTDKVYGSISKLHNNRSEDSEDHPEVPTPLPGEDEESPEVPTPVYIPKSYEGVAGTLSSIEASAAPTRMESGKQVFTLNLKSDIKECRGYSEDISVTGTAKNNWLVNDTCRIDLSQLVPAPALGDSNIYRYYYTYSVTLTNGNTYKSCIRAVTYRIGAYGVVDRDVSVAHDNCCLDPNPSEWRDSNC